jgi:DNA adenine methylase
MQSITRRSNQSSFELHAQIPRCYPFIKWAGGKTQLLPELEKYIPDNFTRYFEPFLGGGAFFFYLISSSSKQLKFDAYLSDINKELINAYKVVKYDVEALVELLSIHEKGYKTNAIEYYYKLRAEQFNHLTDVESAARFITLNKTCYNGLYRVNKDGIFNVPIGRYKNPRICDIKNLQNISRALERTNAHIFARNYREALESVTEEDFIYLDPPYRPTSITARFTSYTNEGFIDNDQIELHKTFKKLDRKGVKIMLSNSDTPFIRELYGDFKEYTSQASALRAINCKTANRTGHKELLVRNYEKR